MSAFSNCNGPDHCGGASLPQIQSLEMLISKVGDLQILLNSTASSLNTLRGTSPTLIPQIDAALSSINSTLSAHTTAISTFMTVTDINNKLALKGDKTDVDALKAAVGTITAAGSATDVGAILRLFVTQLGGYVTSATNVWADVKLINDKLSAPGEAPFTTSKTVASAIGAVQANLDKFIAEARAIGFKLDRPQFKYYFTFTDWMQNGGYLEALTAVDLDLDNGAGVNTAYTQTRIIAMLNDYATGNVDSTGRKIAGWDTPASYGYIPNGEKMTGRCFFKMKDTQAISAIIDATASFGSTTIANGGVVTGTETWAGSLLISGTKIGIPNDVRFGLYLCTGSDGRKHVYLGVYIPAITPIVGKYQKYDSNGNYLYWDSDPTNPDRSETTTFSEWPVMVDAATAVRENYNHEYTLACENMIPAGDFAFIAPVNAVTKLAATSLTTDSSIAIGGAFRADKLIAKEVITDKVTASDGSNMIKQENNDLILGEKDPDKTKALVIYSGDRPTIVHTQLDQGAHQMAYLTDLQTSVYWQQAVKAITPKLADLNNCKVTVYTDPTTSAQTIVTWTATPDSTKGFSNVPGIYLTDPNATAAAGYIFKNGDLGLVEDSGTKTNKLADVSTTIDLSTVTGPIPIDVFMKSLSPPLPIGVLKESATLVMHKDPEGVKATEYSTFTYTRDGAGNITNVNLAAATMAGAYNFTLPAYAHFDGTTWTSDPTDIIDIPGTFDGYAHRTTYEWSGPHAIAPVNSSGVPDFTILPSGQLHFNESYITWTAEYSDGNLNWDIATWSFTNLGLDGYRTSKAQDNIDSALLEYAGIQADWAENSVDRDPSDPTGTTLKDQTVIEVELPGVGKFPVPNPAYIHHKPWTGVAVIDGGRFDYPNIYDGWLADGGDFTGIASAVSGVINRTDPWTSNTNFKNSIIKIWRGAYTDMPEINIAYPQRPLGIWSTYSWTMRWTTFGLYSNPATTDPARLFDELYFSNGTWFEDNGTDNGGYLYRFIPFNSYRAGTRVYQDQDIAQGSGGDLNSFVWTWHFTDFRNKGFPDAGTHPTTWTSLVLSRVDDPLDPTSAINPYDTLNFVITNGPDAVEISSPRMNKAEGDITTISAAIIELSKSLGFDWTPASKDWTPNPDVYSRFASTNALLEAILAAIGIDDTMALLPIVTPVGTPTTVYEAIKFEEERALAVEATLASDLTTEVARAKAAELAIETFVGYDAAAAGPTVPASGLDLKIEDETARAVTVEATKADKLTAPSTPAKLLESTATGDYAETALEASDITTLQTDVTTLQTDVTTLIAAVGDATAGLVKAVADLQTEIVEKVTWSIPTGSPIPPVVPVPTAGSGTVRLTWNGTMFSWAP